MLNDAAIRYPDPAKILKPAFGSVKKMVAYLYRSGVFVKEMATANSVHKCYLHNLKVLW